MQVLQYDLVFYKEVCQQRIQDRIEQSDHSEENRSRKKMERGPILLDDLFKRRKVKPDSPEEDVHKVIIVGNPGTGKH